MEKRQSFLVVYIFIFVAAIIFSGVGIYHIDNTHGQILALEKGRITEATITVLSHRTGARLDYEFIDDYGKKRSIVRDTNMVDSEILYLNGTKVEIYVYGKYGVFPDDKPSYVLGAILFAIGFIMLSSITIFLVSKHVNSRKLKANKDVVND